MSNINYEQEVKKVYPNAVVDFYYDGKKGHYLLKQTLADIPNELYDTGKFWQSAYEQLKKEGKL